MLELHEKDRYDWEQVFSNYFFTLEYSKNLKQLY